MQSVALQSTKREYSLASFGCIVSWIFKLSRPLPEGLLFLNLSSGHSRKADSSRPTVALPLSQVDSQWKCNT